MEQEETVPLELNLQHVREYLTNIHYNSLPRHQPDEIIEVPQDKQDVPRARQQLAPKIPLIDPSSAERCLIQLYSLLSTCTDRKGATVSQMELEVPGKTINLEKRPMRRIRILLFETHPPFTYNQPPPLNELDYVKILAQQDVDEVPEGFGYYNMELIVEQAQSAEQLPPPHWSPLLSIQNTIAVMKQFSSTNRKYQNLFKKFFETHETITKGATINGIRKDLGVHTTLFRNYSIFGRIKSTSLNSKISDYRATNPQIPVDRKIFQELLGRPVCMVQYAEGRRPNHLLIEDQPPRLILYFERQRDSLHHRLTLIELEHYPEDCKKGEQGEQGEQDEQDEWDMSGLSQIPYDSKKMSVRVEKRAGKLVLVSSVWRMGSVKLDERQFLRTVEQLQLVGILFQVRLPAMLKHSLTSEVLRAQQCHYANLIERKIRHFKGQPKDPYIDQLQNFPE